jgi:hypothetical protein
MTETLTSMRTTLTLLKKDFRMYCNRITLGIEQFKSHWFKALLLMFAMLGGFQPTARAQDAIPPTWWFGPIAGSNFNFYHGTVQFPIPTLQTPSPFHNGFGPGLYIGGIAEYRPNPIWGGILQIAYDNRSSEFDAGCFDQLFDD